MAFGSSGDRLGRPCPETRRGSAWTARPRVVIWGSPRRRRLGRRAGAHGLRKRADLSNHCTDGLTHHRPRQHTNRTSYQPDNVTQTQKCLDAAGQGPAPCYPKKPRDKGPHPLSHVCYVRRLHGRRHPPFPLLRYNGFGYWVMTLDSERRGCGFNPHAVQSSPPATLTRKTRGGTENAAGTSASRWGGVLRTETPRAATSTFSPPPVQWFRSNHYATLYYIHYIGAAGWQSHHVMMPSSPSSYSRTLPWTQP